MRNPKTGRVNTLAEHAVNQMASSKNQSQYIAARGAALANGWRAERADGVYGQGWNSAPQQNTRMLTAASAPVGAMQQSQTMASVSGMSTDKSSLLPRAVTRMLAANEQREVAIGERDRERFLAMQREARENNMGTAPLGTAPSAPNYSSARKRSRRTLASLRTM